MGFARFIFNFDARYSFLLSEPPQGKPSCSNPGGEEPMNSFMTCGFNPCWKIPTIPSPGIQVRIFTAIPYYPPGVISLLQLSEWPGEVPMERHHEFYLPYITYDEELSTTLCTMPILSNSLRTPPASEAYKGESGVMKELDIPFNTCIATRNGNRELKCGLLSMMLRNRLSF